MAEPGMALRWIDASAVSRHEVSELPELPARTDGFLGLDVPLGSEQAATVLSEPFGFHPIAINDCRERNHVPRVHSYRNHLSIVVHPPDIGRSGHLHYLELDQFIGPDFLVTVHGPLNPVVPLQTALRETQQVIARMETGRLSPTSPFGLERLAVIAGVTLPITSLSSVAGMNVIVNAKTHWVLADILLLVMIVMSIWLR
jgi:magnesium transporter